MRRNIDVFKARCEESSDSLLAIAVDLIEKVILFSQTILAYLCGCGIFKTSGLSEWNFNK